MITLNAMNISRQIKMMKVFRKGSWASFRVLCNRQYVIAIKLSHQDESNHVEHIDQHSYGEKESHAHHLVIEVGNHHTKFFLASIVEIVLN